MYVHARSAQEIKERFPELTVITDWREWMTPDRLVPIIWNLRSYDLDEPTGYLAEYSSAEEARAASSGRVSAHRPSD